MYAGQRYVRKRSVNNIIEEIKEVADYYPLARVHLEDDTFIIDKQWLKEFVAKYPKIPFKCNVRANLVDEEIVQLLKKANCVSVSFGIEAGNDRIRNEVLHRQMTKEQIISCARLLKKYGIKFITQNILANPTSTLADDIETLDLNLECRPDYPVVSLLQPYPRTEIFRMASEKEQFAQKDIEKMKSFYDVSPLEITQKAERMNLQRIFALVVAQPFLRRYLNFFIGQKKLYFFYSFLYYLWRPYCLMFRIMPHKLSLREFFWLTRRYLTK